VDDANIAVARFYKEIPREQWDPTTKPMLYKPEQPGADVSDHHPDNHVPCTDVYTKFCFSFFQKQKPVEGVDAEVRVYEDKVGVSSLPSKTMGGIMSQEKVRQLHPFVNHLIKKTNILTN
jgi:hypothetical protein